MKNKKKVMILIWNMGIGGIQKRVKDLVIDISQNKKYQDTHTYLLIKFDQPGFFTEELLKKIDPSKLSILYFSKSHQKSKSFSSLFWILYHYISIKPTTLLTFLDHLSIIAVVINKVCFWHRCKLILNEGVVTSTYLKLNRGWKAYSWGALVAIFYRFAHTIIVPSQAVKHDLVKSFYIPSSIITVIPNWTLFGRQAQTKKTIKKRYDITFIGRFEDEKDPLLFFQLVKRLKQKHPGIAAAIAGDGSLLLEMKEFIATHSLAKNIEILPAVPSPIKLLQESKILVVTSKNEGLPNVVLEANAIGLPCVSTSFQGVNEVIQDGKTGWVTDSLDQMSKKVSVLLHNDRLREKMGNQAKKHISAHFSEKNQELFINELLGAFPESPFRHERLSDSSKKV